MDDDFYNECIKLCGHGAYYKFVVDWMNGLLAASQPLCMDTMTMSTPEILANRIMWLVHHNWPYLNMINNDERNYSVMGINYPGLKFDAHGNKI